MNISRLSPILTLLYLTTTPVTGTAQVATPAAPKGTLLDFAADYSVKYGISQPKRNPATRQYESITYKSSAKTADVTFTLDQATLTCDLLIARQGQAGAILINATANPGERVIIEMPDRNILAICDTFDHDTASAISTISAAAGAKVITYRKDSGGIFKNLNQTVKIKRDASGAQTFEQINGELVSLTDIDTESLTPALRAQLTAFLKKVDALETQRRLEAEKRKAAEKAKAPKSPNNATPTPKPAVAANDKAVAANDKAEVVNPFENMNNLYIKYDRNTYSVNQSTQEMGGAIFTGNVFFRVDQIVMNADRVDVNQDPKTGQNIIIATALPGQLVDITALQLDKPMMALCDRFTFNPAQGVNKLESLNSRRPSVVCYQFSDNLIMKNRCASIEIVQKDGKMETTLNNPQGNPVSNPATEKFTTPELENRFMAFLEAARTGALTLNYAPPTSNVKPATPAAGANPQSTPAGKKIMTID